MGGWIVGWAGGWMNVGAGLRIAYDNQKIICFAKRPSSEWHSKVFCKWWNKTQNDKPSLVNEGS